MRSKQFLNGIDYAGVLISHRQREVMGAMNEREKQIAEQVYRDCIRHLHIHRAALMLENPMVRTRIAFIRLRPFLPIGGYIMVLLCCLAIAMAFFRGILWIEVGLGLALIQIMYGVIWGLIIRPIRQE